MPAPPPIGSMFGETGVYKSFLVLNLLLCVASISAPGHLDEPGWRGRR